MTNSLPDFDLYEELQISPSASPEIVAAAYTRLARLYHPDTGERRDETKMVRLNRAHDILSHPERRRVYDLSRTPRRPLTSDRKPFAYGRASKTNAEAAAPGEAQEGVGQVLVGADRFFDTGPRRARWRIHQSGP